MKTALKAVRWTAAILNGVCVLALLALLLPAVVLRGASILQNDPCPALGTWRVYAVQDDALAPQLLAGDLVFFSPQQDYPADTMALCRAEAGVLCGQVLAQDGSAHTLGTADGRVLQAGVPADRMLGAARGYLPRVGAWLTWAAGTRGLCTLLVLGVLLVELPAFLDPHRRRPPFKKAAEPIPPSARPARPRTVERPAAPRRR